MVDFTFLELHLEDSNLTANAPYSGKQTDTTPQAEHSTAETGSRKGTVLAVLVGLGFSIAIAYFVRKRMVNSDSESPFEVDE
jgi:uncharacterized protein HemX